MNKVIKAELHVHLEGTMRPLIAQMLAERNQLKFPKHLLDASQQYYESNDFLKFLQAYDEIAALIQHPRDYFDLTYDYLKESAHVGVIYTEMMYSPEHAEKVSGIPSIEHLLAIQDAITKAEEDYGIKGRIIVTGVRHFGIESCEQVARNAGKHQVPCVVGYGLGGDEIHFPPQDYAKAYAIARDNGLKTTIHAGEFGSAESMITAIKTCKVERIGHGVAAIQSQNTLAMLKDLNIPLEICPSSNVKLGLFSKIEEHPLKKILDHGIDISLNSDDPPFMATEIGHEYDLVQNTFNFSAEKMQEITRMAIKHAFLSEGEKESLLKQI
jgi:adenosine deaminase